MKYLVFVICLLFPFSANSFNKYNEKDEYKISFQELLKHKLKTEKELSSCKNYKITVEQMLNDIKEALSDPEMSKKQILQIINSYKNDLSM